jgi:hypothetical protein
MATENISRIASDFESQISGAISVGATSFTLQSVTDKDGNTLSNGTYCFTIDRDNTSKKEYLIGQLDNATKTVSSISSVSSQGVPTANAQKSHRIGANVIISDHSILSAISRIFTGQGTINPAAPLAYTTAPTLSSATELATKGYVDSVVTGGSVNADRIILGSQTAGATISTGQVVYFDGTDQKWKLADADLPATYAGLLLGIALGSGTDGNPVTDGVLIYGKCDSFSGLTAGSKYYLSTTAGAVSTTESGAVIGFSEDTDTIFVNIDSSGAPSGFVTTSAGAGDAGKGILLASDGKLDVSFFRDVQVVTFSAQDTRYGNDTSRFDVTNPTGTTWRYTWDGAGTNPNINTTNFPTGATVQISRTSTLLSINNCGIFTITGSGTNYFEVTNASGVVNADDTGVYITVSKPQIWTKDSGLKYIIVEGQAGGGSSEGAISHGTAGGGGGAYFRKMILAGSLGATENVFVANGGRYNDVDEGNSGETTSFGSHASATGGFFANGTVGGAGGTATGGDLNIDGGRGWNSDENYTQDSALNLGGTAFWGAQGSGYGAGANGTSASDGNNGRPGFLIVTEFY